MQTDTRQPQPYRNPFAEPNWSPSEKAIARKAFHAALDKELEETVRAAKQRMAGIKEASELWELENWLGKRRRQIDEKYDYRYSVLVTVLARLIHEGRLSESDLNGLREEKMESIRRHLEFARS